MSNMRVVDPRLKKFQKACRARLALSENIAKSDWRFDRPADHANNLLKHVGRALATIPCDDLPGLLKACENVANFAFILHDMATSHYEVHGTGVAILPPPLGPLDAPKRRHWKGVARG